MSLYLFFYSDDDELQRKTHEISRVKAVPKRQEEEGDEMRHHLVAKDPQPLEDISIEGKIKKEGRWAILWSASLWLQT